MAIEPIFRIASCYNCKHRKFKGSDVVVSDDRTPLPNAVRDMGFLGQFLIVPDNDDNPAFLMTSTDGEIRKFHGRYNYCSIYDTNLDKDAEEEIETLLATGDYVQEKGVIYIKEFVYHNISMPDLYEPNDVATYMHSIGAVTSRTSTRRKKYASISDIKRDSLVAQGNDCPEFENRMAKRGKELDESQVKVVSPKRMRTLRKVIR